MPQDGLSVPFLPALSRQVGGAAHDAWLDFTAKPDPQVIRDNFRDFSALVEAARRHAARGDAAMAATHAEAAHGFARERHPGIYACPELDRMLDDIGCAAVPLHPSLRGRAPPTRIRHVLHVCCHVRRVGGVSRLVWRWMQQDATRVHSLALTQQTWGEIPAAMQQAVRARGGRIHFVNDRPGDVLDRARRLRNIGAEADAIVLHIGDDVIPLLAFARARSVLPVIFVDHADHNFWLGAGSSGVVVSLRESGRRLARERRFVPPARSVLLPTPLDPPPPPDDRRAAKRLLGLPEDCVLLLSIARREKYETVSALSFAEAHLPLLRDRPETILAVIGTEARPDWQDAIRASGGRIMAFGQRDDTAPFHAAADVFVDTFPFASITSLLEAGLRGLPLVTLFPYTDAAAVLGADMPGLDGVLVRTRTHAGYLARLDQLVGDAALRRELGDATRARIAAHHTGAGWQRQLEAVYRTALAVGPAVLPDSAPQTPWLGEPDCLMPVVFGQGRTAEATLRGKDRLMPIASRLAQWARDVKAVGPGRWLAEGGLKRCVPEWLLPRLRHRKRGI